MTKSAPKKPRKLSYEILGLIAVSGLLAWAVHILLSGIATAVAESYCFQNDVILTELDWLQLDRWIFRGSTLLALLFFTVLFLSLLGDRLGYIRHITKGIRDLRREQAVSIPLYGHNELTDLAQAINQMSAAQAQLHQSEQALAQEKEQFLRTLSHDIRTPLTSLLAYADYFAALESPTPEQQQEFTLLVQKKGRQIRDLSNLLLEGESTHREFFSDGRLLMAQLAEEFEETLTDSFAVCTDLSRCTPFQGNFDVQQLRRIFDNLASNVQKYADPAHSVSLAISLEEKSLVIAQENRVLPESVPVDSYKLGIPSIRRIAQAHAGRVETSQDGQHYRICVTLSEF